MLLALKAFAVHRRSPSLGIGDGSRRPVPVELLIRLKEPSDDVSKTSRSAPSSSGVTRYETDEGAQAPGKSTIQARHRECLSFAATLQTLVATFVLDCAIRNDAEYLQQVALYATVPKSFAGGLGKWLGTEGKQCEDRLVQE